MQRHSKTKDTLTNKSPKVVSWQKNHSKPEVWLSSYLPDYSSSNTCLAIATATKLLYSSGLKAFYVVTGLGCLFFQVCTAVFIETWAFIGSTYVRGVQEPKSGCFLQEFARPNISKYVAFRSFPYGACNLNAAYFFYLLIWSCFVLFFKS